MKPISKIDILKYECITYPIAKYISNNILQGIIAYIIRKRVDRKYKAYIKHIDLVNLELEDRFVLDSLLSCYGIKYTSVSDCKNIGLINSLRIKYYSQQTE